MKEVEGPRNFQSNIWLSRESKKTTLGYNINQGVDSEALGIPSVTIGKCMQNLIGSCLLGRDPYVKPFV